MSYSDLFLRQATLDDADAIVSLLNLTFRSDVGWTNEANLVGGIRTTVEEVRSILENPDNYFFVYPELKSDSAQEADKEDTAKEDTDKEETGKVLATISVTFKREANSAYIGLFTVDPSLQGQGVGNQVLQAAETFATRHLSANDNKDKVRLTMSILSQRPDLQAYYERRGYQLSGNSQPFPVDSNNGEPKVEGLRLLELVKVV